MKYTAVIDTDDFENFEFFEDGNGKYLHAVDAGAVNGEWVYLPFKPLNQEPCEDAISRQAVLEGKVIHQSCDGVEIINSYAVPVEYIEQLPSIQPKTGHWIEEFNDLEGEVRCTCSSCGKYQLFGTDYCYNCGAKMIELQESEDKE